MSERDDRSELAGIARRLARVIQRERDGGEGLAQAAARAKAVGALRGPSSRPQGAAPAIGGSPAKIPPARPPSVMTPPTPPVVADASSDAGASGADGPASGRGAREVHPDDVAPPVVDLFGDGPAKKPSYAPLDFSKLPSHHDPLNPIDAAERAAIHAAALPILGAVAAEARECRKCGLCETRTKAVPGTGSASTGIVFVGEAPGADEDAQGEPFVGRAGKLLTEIIKGMDDRQLIPGVSLTRETVYICNVLKCRPPENRNPLPHEIEACSPYLDRQLEALKPRIICCLGKFAAELLVGVKGTIRDMRGKVYRYKGARLIVTYHPAAILRSPHQYRRPVWEDMQFLAREYLSD